MASKWGDLSFSRLSLTGACKEASEMEKKGSSVFTGFDASKSNFLDKIARHLTITMKLSLRHMGTSVRICLG